jgi:hypothetical protein
MFVLTPGKELDVVAAGDPTELHEGHEPSACGADGLSHPEKPNIVPLISDDPG